jgi:hypothetical protein
MKLVGKYLDPYTKNTASFQNWIIGIISTLFFLKSWNLILNPSLWAEDANVFLKPLLQNFGEPAYLQVEPYNGQYWFLNHFIWNTIFVVSNGNYLLLPFLGSVSSLILVLLCASFWLRDNVMIQSRWLRIAIYGYALFGPSSWEIIGTPTGVHTYFLVGIFAMMGWQRPHRLFWKVFEWVIILFCSFTSTLAVFLLIVYVYRFWRDKNIEISKTVYLLTAIVIQSSLWFTRANGSEFRLGIDSTLSLINGLIIRVGSELLIGQNGGTYLESRVNTRVFSFVGLIVLTIFIVYFLTLRSSFTSQAKFIIIGPLIFFLAYSFLITRVILSSDPASFVHFGWVGRYFYIVHFLTFLLIISFQAATKSRVRLISVMVILVFLSGLAADFRIVPKNSLYPSTSWHEFIDCYKLNASNCSVTVTPGAGWGLDIPKS